MPRQLGLFQCNQAMATPSLENWITRTDGFRVPDHYGATQSIG